MLALRDIVGRPCLQLHTANTAYYGSDLCSDTPILTPGKYRPLTAPEIKTIVDDDSPTPYIDHDGSDFGYQPGVWKHMEKFIAALRLLFGPHVHPLTDDMARQFANQPVYYLHYIATDHAISLGHYTHENPTRKDRLSHLQVGLLTTPFGKIKFRQPRDGFVLRSMHYFPGCNDHARFFEPYSPYPHYILMVDRSGLVMDEGNIMPLIVFAEKLD